jgi:hypothetical protein
MDAFFYQVPVGTTDWFFFLERSNCEMRDER